MSGRVITTLAALLIAVGPGSAGAAPAGRSRAPARPSVAVTAAAAARDSSRHEPAAPAGAGQSAHPTFTGRWQLSMTKSVFGKIPGGQPTARTDTIAHDGARLRQTLFLLRGAQRDTTIYDYLTDGTPTDNKVDGRNIRTIATWEGPVLHLESTTNVLMFTMTMSERWSLSPDARTFTDRRHLKYGFGEGDQTLVFERE